MRVSGSITWSEQVKPVKIPPRNNSLPVGALISFAFIYLFKEKNNYFQYKNIRLSVLSTQA